MSWIVLVAALAQTPAHATVLPPEVTIVYYDVGGRNVRQVRQALASARPVVDGAPKDAVTRWRYNTTWSNQADGSCLPATARIDHSIILTLPRLADGRDLRPQERERWGRFVASVTEHEMGRINLVIEGLESIQALLRRTADCDDLLFTRERLVAELNDRLRIRDEEAAEWQRRNRFLAPTL